MSDLVGVKFFVFLYLNSIIAKYCIRRKKICFVIFLLFIFCEKILNKFILRYYLGFYLFNSLINFFIYNM